MRKFEYALIMALVCIAIIAAALIMRMMYNPGAEQTVLPTPEIVTPAEVLLMRAEAPEVERTGLAEYETFEAALERARAAVPEDVVQLAGRAIWGEAGGLTRDERAAVVWCACNRADAWDMGIRNVLVVSQFHGLAITGDVPEEHLEVARDVLARWALEHEGWIDVGRVLPSRFLYFEGDGQRNYFSTEYGGGEYWQGW